MKNFRIGICFSGGGARGVAHIGVLKALLEHDIRPDVIAGTSAGAIVGALHAAGKSPEEMMEFAMQGSLFKIYKIGIPKGGLTRLTYLRNELEKAIPEDDFSSLSIPLYISMTNLNTGAIEIRSSGKLHEVIEASCSVPLLFKPVEIDGQLFVDGGLLNNLPVLPILTKADFIIGANVRPQVSVDSANLNSWSGIAYRVFDLSLHANIRASAPLCHFMIEPEGIHQHGIWQFSRLAEIYSQGYETAKKLIPSLQESITERKKVLDTETPTLGN